MNQGLLVRERSAPGRGAVSVLEFEGQAALAWLERASGRSLPAPGALAFVRLCEAGVELDEALLVPLAAQRFELHVHGSPPLVRRLLALGNASTQPSAALAAEPRASELLARVRGEAGARMLLDQAEGALRRELRALAPSSAERRRAALAQLAERGRVARWLVDPARVVIAGPTNAGKSTLFNALLGEGRALVHAQAGTTRDVLREPALFGAYPVWLHDTAGERALEPSTAAAEIERAGQARAREFVAGADLVLWLDPAAGPAPAGACLVRLRSRAPVAELGAADALAALEQPELARQRCAAHFRACFDLPEQPWIAGAGVPFDPALAEGLAALDPAASQAEWGSALERVLGPEPAGFDCLLGANALSSSPRDS